tara:strand:+ start:165 stop:428 length:264 start_codon:yes stop_codon:yes gene_type:complete
MKSLASIHRQENVLQKLEKNMEDVNAFAGEIMACNMMTEDASGGIDALVKKLLYGKEVKYFKPPKILKHHSWLFITDLTSWYHILKI